MAKITKQIPFGNQTIILETGEIARQATASVVVSLDDTMVLVTVVAKKDADPKMDFFPLTVNYIEKTYAAGRIPGGFLKREGRPSDNETLVSRLIDRPIRPLFPKGFNNEVQVVATVLSHNPEVNPDMLAMVGASAALALSGLPFAGPIGAMRVGYKDGIYVSNPTTAELLNSDLDLVVAGSEKAILMVESGAKELPEQVMLGAVLYGHEMMQNTIKAIKALADEAGKPKWSWAPSQATDALLSELKVTEGEKIAQAYQIREKAKREEALSTLRAEIIARVITEKPELTAVVLKDLISKIEKETVRKRILAGDTRIDGRDTRTVRPITVRTGVLPRAHGSALFTRGETQALAVVTLGNERDALFVDALAGEQRDRFILHYNFPPYSVGETGMMGSPKRREIGHGKLARRGLENLIPQPPEFPYVIRVVSEITESNGSSSMASVCGTSLALMDAGVPLKSHVAGIAMGLIKEGDKFEVLTDIIGDEDYLGDMDFKVAGTQKGVTALQMDIKIDGITKEILKIALEQALEGRIHILGIMESGLSTARDTLSEYAPRIHTMKIDSDKIRDVIGKGGVTIRSITEETGVSIDIADDGTIQLFSADKHGSELAIQRIKDIVAEVEVGQVYEGKVSKIVDFGAFVNILPGKDGLLHVSQISSQRVENVSDVLTEGQIIQVKVVEVDRQGRIRLSIKAIVEEQAESSESSAPGQSEQSVESR